MLRSLRRLSLLAALALILLPGAHAQDVDAVADVTRAFAVTNARIVVAPGQVIERGTVVVRDGLIEAVGATGSTRVPYDARVIAGDSLTVYAAFISGLSHAGVPKPKDDPYRGDVESRSQPEPDRAGIQPQRDVRGLLDASDASIEALRNVGFGAAHVVPRGRLLPGQGALVVLAGDDPSAMVVRGETAVFAQFDGAIGAYPSTPMGVMAVIRQHAKEAARRQEIGEAYAGGPRGRARAPYDPIHEAFFPVLDGQQPMLFHVEGVNELHRALRLQSDLGYGLMLAGLSGAQYAVDALREADAPLFLTMDLPKAMKDDSLAVDYAEGMRTPSYREAEAEQANLEARKRAAIASSEATAATLASAGLTFGFATEELKPADLPKHLRRMIEAGLSEDDALAALTTDAAMLLGASDVLGTVAKGKIANLILAQGSVFAEDAEIRMMLVDGRLFEMEEKGTGEAPAEGLSATGAYAATIETPEGAYEATITLEGSNAALTGSVSSPAFTAPASIDEARLEGDQLTVVFTAPQFGRLTMTGTLTATTYTGTVEVPQLGSFPFSADRTPER